MGQGIETIPAANRTKFPRTSKSSTDRDGIKAPRTETAYSSLHKNTHPALFHTTSQHDDGTAILLPDHPPEVVPRTRKRSLRHDELPWTVETLWKLGRKKKAFVSKLPYLMISWQRSLGLRHFYRHVVGVDVIGAFLVVGGHQFDTGMVVREDVCEAIFGAVHGKIRRHTGLIPSDVLQVLQNLRKKVKKMVKNLIFHHFFKDINFTKENFYQKYFIFKKVNCICVVDWLIDWHCMTSSFGFIEQSVVYLVFFGEFKIWIRRHGTYVIGEAL